MRQPFFRLLVNFADLAQLDNERPILELGGRGFETRNRHYDKVG